MRVEFTWYLKQRKRSICTCLQCLLFWTSFSYPQWPENRKWNIKDFIYRFYICSVLFYEFSNNQVIILDVIKSLIWNENTYLVFGNWINHILFWFDKYDDLWCHEHKNVIQQHVFCFVVSTFYRKIKAFY